MASNRALALAAALCALLAAPAARAQGPVDVSGFWQLQTSVSFGEAEGPADCEYQGSAEITQDGSDLGGTSSLQLESGSGFCPGAMTADVDGEITGNTIEMGMLIGGGQFGTAQWTGTVASLAEGGGVTGGDFVVDSGPFSGASGSWSAQRGEPPALAIPTLSTVGAVVLVAVLLAAAALLLRRRSAAAA